MESKKINQLATELAPELSDLTIIGDPTTGISKKITLSQMASLFTGTVEEYANLASFPLVGAADTIYIALDTNIIYRWNTGTSAYVELSPNIVTSLVFSDANGFDGTISLVGSTATLTITTALTQGSVPFIGTSGALTQDNANLFFDDTNNRLGINTNSPTTALDVFGSGIIGRINGTSTNNAFLGFASAGTNKWSVGNVQSDHRFRIYNEATTSELVSVLQTGEFGIGIANPTTKLHIDGGANALIANLDANVSVAKSISFRSDNSNRINIEVSGTESGSNAGADFQIKRYSDAGSLIDTPFTIFRSTGLGNYAKDFTVVGLPSLGTGAAGDLMYIGDRTTLNTTYLKISRAGGVVTGIPNIASVTGGIGPATLTFSATAFGFNQSDPKSTLHVTDGNITISKSASGSGTVVGSLDFRNDYASPNYVWAQIKAFNGGTHDSSNISFSTWNGFNSLTERLRIFQSGEMALGMTTTPYAKFSIKSNATTAYSGFNIFATGNGNFTFLNHDNNVGWIGTEFATGGTGHTPLAFSVGGTERLRISTTGKITNGNAGAGDWAFRILGNSSTSNSYGIEVLAGTNSSDSAFSVRSASDAAYFRVRGDGYIYLNSITYNSTTATSANMYLFGGYDIGRSTSSARYKTEIEDIEDEYANNIFKMKPKWYRSLCEKDNKDWSHFGFIAEEMAEIEPRLVHWFEEEDGTFRADGVQYDRITALLVKIVQKQEERIKQLESK